MAEDNIAFKSFYYSLGTTSFRMQNFNQKIEQQLDLLDQFWHKTEYMNEKWESNESVQAIFLKEGDAPRKAKDALDYFIAEKTVTEKTFCKVVLNRKSKDYDRAYLPLYNAMMIIDFMKQELANEKRPSRWQIFTKTLRTASIIQNTQVISRWTHSEIPSEES